MLLAIIQFTVVCLIVTSESDINIVLKALN